jgi:dipeptidyl aminopeptidase/acylaminoacyl peptidase
MGAATSIFHMANKPNEMIKCAVLDSSFCNLKDIALDMTVNQFGMPLDVINGMFVHVNTTIKNQTGMELDKLNPMDVADKCTKPSLFIHGIDDNFIKMEHSEKNMEKYGGEADCCYCEGDHNTPRPDDARECAIEFLKKYLLSE